MIATLRRLLLVGAAAISLSSPGLAQDSADIWQAIGKASAAYDRADYVEAARWYRLAADQGDLTAQYFLGSMYDEGEGVPKSFEVAARWYRLAADQGQPLAQLRLGDMYEYGEGVPQNFIEAYKWYNIASVKGGRSATISRDLILVRMTPAQIAEGQRLSAAWKPK